MEAELSKIHDYTEAGRRHTLYALIHTKTKQNVVVYNEKSLENDTVREVFPDDLADHERREKTGQLVNIIDLLDYIKTALVIKPSTRPEDAIVVEGVPTYAKNNMGGGYISVPQQRTRVILERFDEKGVYSTIFAMGSENPKVSLTVPAKDGGSETLHCLISRESNNLYVYATAIFAVTETLPQK